MILLFLFFKVGALLLINEGVNAQLSAISFLSKSAGKNVIVSMEDSTIPIINSVDKTGLARDELATVLTQKLKVFSAKSQLPVVSLLEKLGADFQSTWLTNQIFVKAASLGLVKTLKGIPSVKSVAKEELFPLDLLFDFETGSQPNGTEWHLKKMKVDKVWKKTKGEGIIVAAIDTGVKATHQSLKDNYIGNENYGWYDPVLFTKEPNDVSGHGTHVMGIMAGNGGIGAAPEAKWMACRAGIEAVLLENAVITCAQYLLCPSDSKGTCKNVPHVISNSWGPGGGRNWFHEITSAWVKVGIKPFFAVGNEGPRCASARSPADYDNVIAVGSTDKNDRLHKTSSRGPAIRYERHIDQKIEENKDVLTKRLIETVAIALQPAIPTEKIKPDIVAPGVDINSAYILSDKSYEQMTGTSMATPAAAGVAALLLSIKPKMTLKKLKNLLYTTTDKNFPESNSEQCGGIPEDEFPNNLYGHGRINAYKAYKKLEKKMKAVKAAKNKEVTKS